jgi:hypothetical protein
MGQHANQRAWLEFERLDRMKQEQSFDDDEPLTEAERASEWDRQYWDRIDAEARISAAGGWK